MRVEPGITNYKKKIQQKIYHNEKVMCKDRKTKIVQGENQTNDKYVKSKIQKTYSIGIK